MPGPLRLLATNSFRRMSSIISKGDHHICAVDSCDVPRGKKTIKLLTTTSCFRHVVFVFIQVIFVTGGLWANFSRNTWPRLSTWRPDAGFLIVPRDGSFFGLPLHAVASMWGRRGHEIDASRCQHYQFTSCEQLKIRTEAQKMLICR